MICGKLIVGNIVVMDGEKYNVEKIEFSPDGFVNITLIHLPVIENINLTYTVME